MMFWLRMRFVFLWWRIEDLFEPLVDLWNGLTGRDPLYEFAYLRPEFEKKHKELHPGASGKQRSRDWGQYTGDLLLRKIFKELFDKPATPADASTDYKNRIIRIENDIIGKWGIEMLPGGRFFEPSASSDTHETAEDEPLRIDAEKPKRKAERPKEEVKLDTGADEFVEHSAQLLNMLMKRGAIKPVESKDNKQNFDHAIIILANLTLQAAGNAGYDFGVLALDKLRAQRWAIDPHKVQTTASIIATHMANARSRH